MILFKIMEKSGSFIVGKGNVNWTGKLKIDGYGSNSAHRESTEVFIPLPIRGFLKGKNLLPRAANSLRIACNVKVIP